MQTPRLFRFLLPCLLLLAIVVPARGADESSAKAPDQAHWPRQVVVNVGDIRTRIDGPKLWTLSGIDYQDALMATENSAYGTVLTIRNVGPFGTAHFLDVPGKPGEVEKEIVTDLKLFVDDQLVVEFTPRMELRGTSFRMERKSKIRVLDLETTVSIRDGVLTESAHFLVNEPIDLKNSYPFMYAWNAQATHYVFGDETGVRKRGEFLKEGKTVAQVVKDNNWMAVFNPTTGKGSVCCFVKHPDKTEASFLLVDAPGSYRKVAAYTLVDTIVPQGFKGTYQSAVGFFTATPADWESQALRRAAEIRSAK